MAPRRNAPSSACSRAPAVRDHDGHAVAAAHAAGAERPGRAGRRLRELAEGPGAGVVHDGRSAAPAEPVMPLHERV